MAYGRQKRMFSPRHLLSNAAVDSQVSSSWPHSPLLRSNERWAVKPHSAGIGNYSVNPLCALMLTVYSLSPALRAVYLLCQSAFHCSVGCLHTPCWVAVCVTLWFCRKRILFSSCRLCPHFIGLSVVSTVVYAHRVLVSLSHSIMSVVCPHTCPSWYPTI